MRYITAALAFLVGIYAVVFMFGAAHAQGRPCAPINVIMEGLTKRYNETPVLKLDGQRGHFLLIFVSGAKGSWSVIDVSPKGIGCQVAVGEGWTEADLPARGDPA